MLHIIPSKPSLQTTDFRVIINPMLTNKDYKFFAFFSLSWVILGWLAFVLAMAGFFSAWIFVIFFALGIGLLIKFNLRQKLHTYLSREFFILIATTLTTVIIFSFFVTPTIFTGRDQGSISTTAIQLAQNQQLSFSTPASTDFFKLYGVGRALNFPGFHYTADGKLLTQFPLPYVAWLAVFYALFGLIGFVVGNVILLFLFITAFYLLLRNFLDKHFSQLGTLLAATAFTTFWFFKFTLSENLALALFWLGALNLILFLKEKTALAYFSTLAVFGLLFFARIEGMAILAILLAILLFQKNSRQFMLARKIQRLLYPALIFISFFSASLFTNLPYYTEMAKVFLKNSHSFAAGDMAENSLAIFFLYGLLPLIILGLVGIINLWRRQKYLALMPFLLTLPTFTYLLNPQISDDHPWLLRRFVFSVVPALILGTIFFLEHIRHKKLLRRALIIILLFFNAFLPAQYLPFSENKNLLPQTEKLSQNFSVSDLILIDRLATGDGFSMLAGPINSILGKNAVYFFNPNDLAKIDTKKYVKIYLVAPENNLAFWQNSALGQNLQFSQNYSLQTQRLVSAKNNSLPEKQPVIIHGKIFEIVPN